MAEPQARGASWPLAVRSSYAEANFLARVRAITRAHSTATLHFLLSSVKRQAFFPKRHKYKAVSAKSQTISNTTTVPLKHYHGTVATLPRYRSNTTAVA